MVRNSFSEHCYKSGGGKDFLIFSLDVCCCLCGNVLAPNGRVCAEGGGGEGDIRVQARFKLIGHL